MTQRKNGHKGPSNVRSRYAMAMASGAAKLKYWDEIEKAIKAGFDGRPRNRMERRRKEWRERHR